MWAVPAILCLSLAGAFGAASQAAGQSLGRAAGFENLMAMDYLHRDLVTVANALNLDDGQRIIIENFFTDYRDAFESGWQATNERLATIRDDVRDADRDVVMQLVLAPFEEWRAEKERLREDFESNIKLILNEDQMNRWDAFQRQLRREKTLHRGELSGESINLFHVLRDLRLDERLERDLEPVMEQYAIALDDALRRREQAMGQDQQHIMSSLRDQNLREIAQRMRRQADERVRVRNVNDEHIEIITANLPEEHQHTFRAMALERAYPRAYRRHAVERLFAAALEIEGLDEETLAAIRSLDQSMRSELASLAGQIHHAIREHEPRAKRHAADLYRARQSGDTLERLEDPTVDLLRNREERAADYVTQLRALLTEEQFASLPNSGRWLTDRRAEIQDRDQALQERRRLIRERDARQRGGRHPQRGRDGRGAPQRGRDGGRGGRGGR